MGRTKTWPLHLQEFIMLMQIGITVQIDRFAEMSEKFKNFCSYNFISLRNLFILCSALLSYLDSKRAHNTDSD